MVSKEQKKINRVMNFLRKGLTSLADELEDTVKTIDSFVKSLQKAQKDLKGVSSVEEVQTVSTSSKQIAASGGGVAKTKAASTLFNLLSTGPEKSAPAPAIGASISPPGGGGPPKAPSSGPPKAPSSGPPKAPSSGPPKRANLPAAPKLPPALGSSAPSKPPDAGHVVSPTFAKSPTPPGSPPGVVGPPTAPGGVPPVTAPKTGGGLGSLRDEMLEELTRLKKIMRGE
ncbi:MAG: hypothetical protein ACTSUT_12810 [Promethearchaeota archaeon]